MDFNKIFKEEEEVIDISVGSYNTVITTQEKKEDKKILLYGCRINSLRIMFDEKNKAQFTKFK